MRRILISALLALFVPVAAHAAALQPSEARRHVGEQATVCGTIASAHYAPWSRGQPTFLDLGHAYPNEDLVAVVWGNDRARFGAPERLAGQRVCISGPILLYRGKPEIVLREASQLTH